MKKRKNPHYFLWKQISFTSFTCCCIKCYNEFHEVLHFLYALKVFFKTEVTHRTLHRPSYQTLYIMWSCTSFPLYLHCDQMEHLPRNRYIHQRNSLRSILHNDRKMTYGNLKYSYLPLPPSSKWCPFLASNRKHRRCMSMIALSTNAFVKLPAAFFNRRMYSPLVSRLFFGNFFSQGRMTRVTLKLK